MKSSFGVLHPRMQPVLRWLIEQQADRKELENRLRKTLGSKGVADKHLRGLATLDDDGCDFFASHLGGSENKVRALLRTLEILGQCRCQEGSVTSDQLAGLGDLFSELPAPKLNIGTLTTIIRAWIDEIEETNVLKDVIDWAITSEAKIQKNASWAHIVRSKFRGVVFESPINCPKEIDGVTIRQLRTTEELIEEGREMDHCLKGTALTWSYASKAIAKEAVFFHLNKAVRPNICATLEIERHPRGWKISNNFQTVGNGDPPKPLKLAAQKLTHLINESQGFDVDWDADEEDDDDLF